MGGLVGVRGEAKWAAYLMGILKDNS
jgi:hypothetical protein